VADFVNIQIPNTVIGIGAISRIADLVKNFAPTKIAIITEKGIVKAGVLDMVKSPLQKAGYRFDIFDDGELEPSISSLEELGNKIKDGKYDLLVGVGGGSTMDSTKVADLIAANEGISVYDLVAGKPAVRTIPKILIPTTSGSGSEWSIAAVVSDDKANRVTRLILTPNNFPNGVIIDPELTLNLPQTITADTGMDALTHAIEAYTSAKASIISDMLAGTAIKLISDNLRMAYGKGSINIEARYNMAVAASLAMLAASVSSVGLVHYMNEPLGKRAHIPHGKACTMLLPNVMEYNLVANPPKFAKVAELMGENISGLPVMGAAAKSVDAVRRLAKDLGMPKKLSEIRGNPLAEADIPSMVKEVHSKMGPMINETNPRDVSPEETKQIFSILF